ncbi:helix-turn-helix transcriptional regulator [Paracoccus sp. Z330]|uniref:Helix-turn-helix transcriptional regulator n=1 Tax=Paracoccus onchidii TaxID=3017813 RepID=A0ABT4ZFN8_9RHOB|nr:helix-turn-helix transcriptional regulator [Paracoccus onchidii]MDB6177917.1 helix-turn-helix transcriptional regulator [Paracoccus onchidii]
MNLKQIRLARGLTQKDVAEMADVEQPTVSKIEQGFDGVTLRTLNKIAEALDITLADLVGESRTGPENAILSAFRRLPPERQQGWIDMAEMLAPHSSKEG